MGYGWWDLWRRGYRWRGEWRCRDEEERRGARSFCGEKVIFEIPPCSVRSASPMMSTSWATQAKRGRTTDSNSPLKIWTRTSVNDSSFLVGPASFTLADRTGSDKSWITKDGFHAVNLRDWSPGTKQVKYRYVGRHKWPIGVFAWLRQSVRPREGNGIERLGGKNQFLQ